MEHDGCGGCALLRSHRVEHDNIILLVPGGREGGANNRAIYDYHQLILLRSLVDIAKFNTVRMELICNGGRGI